MPVRQMVILVSYQVKEKRKKKRKNEESKDKATREYLRPQNTKVHLVVLNVSYFHGVYMKQSLNCFFLFARSCCINHQAPNASTHLNKSVSQETPSATEVDLKRAIEKILWLFLTRPTTL